MCSEGPGEGSRTVCIEKLRPVSARPAPDLQPLGSRTPVEPAQQEEAKASVGRPPADAGARASFVCKESSRARENKEKHF